jgi:hypothetical protein
MNRAGLVLAALALAAPRSAAAERYAVVIGSNAGALHEPILEFAERDATRMADVFTSVGGVRPEHLVFVQSPDAAAARRALIATNERIRAQSAGDSVLVVYYSGHGDTRALHLGGTELALAELDGLVRGSAARVRVLIVDACDSGMLTRTKGGRPAPARMVPRFRLTGDGVVVLAASAAGEAAQESPDLGGSFFTHHLISGLLGAADVDRDGKVTVSEAYDYAYTHTLRDSSATIAGVQRPTYRYEMGGQGEFALTELRSGTRAQLRIPAGLDVFVMRGSASGPIVAEARTPTDRPAVLSVAAGRVFVRVRAPRALFEAEMSLRAGQTYELATEAMDKVELTRLARKGGTHVPFVAGIGLAGFAHRGVADGHSLCAGAAARGSLVYRSISIAPRLGACREEFHRDDLASVTTEVEAAVALNLHRDLFRRWSVYIGPELGASYFRQRLDRQLGGASARNLLGGVLAIQGGIDFNLGAGIVVGPRLMAQTRFLRLDNPTTPSTGRSAVFTWGGEFGATLYFP